MTETEPNIMRSGKQKRRVSGPLAAVMICLVLAACAVPFLHLLSEPLHKPVPPTPTSISETPAQIQQNAAFIKKLQSLPAGKRGAYFGAHQDQSRQAALSPDPAQRKAIYALAGKTPPNP